MEDGQDPFNGEAARAVQHLATSAPTGRQLVTTAASSGRFDYDTISEFHRSEVLAAASRINAGLARGVREAVAIGNDLRMVKERIGRGRFMRWIAAEFEMSSATALLSARPSRRYRTATSWSSGSWTGSAAPFPT